MERNDPRKISLGSSDKARAWIYRSWKVALTPNRIACECDAVGGSARHGCGFEGCTVPELTDRSSRS